MIVSATFNARDLSPYTEDCFEDLLDLRTNPFEEGEVDTDQNCTSQGKEETQVTSHSMLSLFSLNLLEWGVVLEGLFGGIPKPSHGVTPNFVGLLRRSPLREKSPFWV